MDAASSDYMQTCICQLCWTIEKEYVDLVNRLLETARAHLTSWDVEILYIILRQNVSPYYSLILIRE